MSASKISASTRTLAGISLMVGGMESALAGAIILDPKDFTLSGSEICNDEADPFCRYGSAAEITSSKDVLFEQFGGDATDLESVWITFTVRTVEEQISEAKSSVEVDTTDVSFPSEISSELSVNFSVDLEGSEIWSLLNPIELMAGCTTSEITTCDDMQSEDLTDDLGFMIHLTGADDLTPFLGLGSFELTPRFAGTVSYSASGDNLTGQYGETYVNWFGSVEVQYHVRMESVPEPASLWLLGGGLAALAGTGWRRRRKTLREN